MAMDVICPSCGFRNPPDATACGSCNYPLTPLARGADAGEPAPGASLAGAPSYEPPQRQLTRPQRRAAPLQGQSVWLWLLFGTFAAGVLIYTAINANRQRAVEAPVAGSSNEQQQTVDRAHEALAADSTNVEAHLALANVLYDTANWDDAIVHYRAVLRRDSTRVPVIVDLGVAYYNLGDSKQAEQLFRRALELDPHQTIALYNLGIVSERRGEMARALEYYHRALETAPPEELKGAIVSAVERTSQQAGKRAPPLTQSPPAGK